MKKRALSICVFIVVFIVALLPSNVYASEGVPEEVLNKTASVFYIEAWSGRSGASGTAFLIHSAEGRSLLLTNRHVISINKNNVTVFISETEKCKAKVIASSEQYDLAVLQVAEALGVPLLLSDSAQQGDAVFAAGFPGDADILSDTHAVTSEQATITDGVISAIRSMKIVEYGPSVSILQMNAEINHGNSGGPLFNAKGEVVGVNTYGVTSANGIYGAINAASVITFLQEVNLFADVQMTASTNSIPGLTAEPTPAKDTGSFFVDKDAPSYSLFIVLAVVVLGMISIILMAIINKKTKNRGNDSKNESPVYSLEQYLKMLPEQLSCEDITVLLLPVAKEMRNKHADGSLLLRLSPEMLTVSKNGCAIIPTKENAFSNPQFIAPEQISRGIASVKTDIYAFCKMLDYLYQQGRQIETNSEAKESCQNCDDSSEDFFQQIVAKGTLQNADDRYSSMQEILFDLASFNKGALSTSAVGPFSSAKNDYDKLVRKKSKKRYFIVGALTVVIAVGAIIGNQLLSWRMMDRYAQENNPEELIFWWAQENDPWRCTDSELYRYYAWAGHFFTEEDYETAGSMYKELNGFYNSSSLYQECRYRIGNQLLENRQFDEAESVFSEIQSYKDSSERLQEVTYRRAASFANNGYYDEAIRLYNSIREYKDSATLIDETQFRKGYSLLSTEEFAEAEIIFKTLKTNGYSGAADALNETYYSWAEELTEQKDYITAYQKLQKCKNYKDSGDFIAALTEIIYSEGIKQYNAGQYISSKKYFSTIQPYGRSDDYLFLVGMHSNSDPSKADINELKKMIGFADAAALIFRTGTGFRYFMEGTWKDSTYHFTLDSSGYINYNLPGFKYGEYYKVVNGDLLLFYEKTPNLTKTLFSFTVIDRNTVSVLCAKDGKRYTLTRTS